MESTDGRYGWAADDPRWTDALAGGRGRLEPPPPSPFADPPFADPPFSGSPVPDSLLADPPFAGAPGAVPLGAAAEPPSLFPAWPPAPPSPEPPAPEPPPSPDEPLTARSDFFGPPLAIAAAPAVAPPPAFPSPVPTSVPLRVHTLDEAAIDAGRPSLPAPGGGELRVGYGLSTAATAAATAAPAGLVPRDARTTRLDRRVRIRSRRWTDDEFRRSGRAELFSDDARYPVLFALTAGWFGLVIAVYLVWVLLVSGEGAAASVLSGLAWLTVAGGLSVGVAGLLRWASVGWRAITLSLAAALIGGGVTTIAQTLTG